MNHLKNKVVTAKKEHQCDWCNGTIHKGEKYRYAVWEDGGLQTGKSHLHCERLADLLGLFDEDDEIGIESFECAIQDYVLENHGDEKSLTFEEGWDMHKIPFPEIVKKVYNELK